MHTNAGWDWYASMSGTVWVWWSQYQWGFNWCQLVLYRVSASTPGGKYLTYVFIILAGGLHEGMRTSPLPPRWLIFYFRSSLEPGVSLSNPLVRVHFCINFDYRKVWEKTSRFIRETYFSKGTLCTFLPYNIYIYIIDCHMLR